MKFELAEGSELVMLDPFVSPEHKEIIDKAVLQLKDYEENLMKRLLYEYPAAESRGCEMSISAIRRLFIGDPIRHSLIRAISDMKSIWESPRYLIKTRQAKTDSN